MALQEFDRATDEEPKSAVLLEEDAVAVEPPAEDAALPIETDPVRLYFGEMGKVRLLTAAQEIEIGRRIEAGQAKLQEALGAIPMVVRTLAVIGDRLRRDASIANDIVVSPDGTKLNRKGLAPILRAFDRLRRWSKSRTARGSAIQALVAAAAPARAGRRPRRSGSRGLREGGGTIAAAARDAARADRQE